MRLTIMAAPALFAAALVGPIEFKDVTPASRVSFQHRSGSMEKNYLIDTVGSGVALFDYDRDGRVDLLLVNAAPNGSRLYRNVGAMKFLDVTEAAGVRNPGVGMGAAAADLDNDGWPDLYLTNYGSNVLLKNNGDGTFREVTRQAGVQAGNWSTGAAWGDYDGDGRLDLYVARYVEFDPRATPRKGATAGCRYRDADVACGPRGLPGLADILYRNNGDGTFTDVTAAARIHDPGFYGLTVLWLDYDRDGNPDIFVANDATPNFLWRNNGDGTFSEVGAEAAIAYNENGQEQACMGAAAGDFDNDGRVDLFVTNFSDDDNTLYRNSGAGLFTDVTRRARLAGRSWLEMGWGTGLVDFDNDGWKDLFVANGHIYPEVNRIRTDSTYQQRLQLFRNAGDGIFTEVSAMAGKDFQPLRSARGASFADLDNDGCVDVVVNNLDDRALVLRNNCAGGNHWLALDLEGVASNRDALGAFVVLRVGDRTLAAELSTGSGYIGTSDRRLWFGLGRHEVADRVDIAWPSGKNQVLTNVRADRLLKVREPGGQR